MAQTRYFTKEQIDIVHEASDMAEEFVLLHFGINWEEWKSCLYDLKTQKFQSQNERTDRALAQVCKYGYSAPAGFDKSEHDFYSICLQDHLILETAENRGGIILLAPLLLYISTHELIHVIRFTRFKLEFDVEKQVKAKEEKEVHNLTYNVLAPVSENKMKILKPVLNGFKKHRELTAN